MIVKMVNISNNRLIDYGQLTESKVSTNQW